MVNWLIVKQRFEEEISLWANLKNNHILPFYGIVTDLGQHMHMVHQYFLQKVYGLYLFRCHPGKRMAMYLSVYCFNWYSWVNWNSILSFVKSNPQANRIHLVLRNFVFLILIFSILNISQILGAAKGLEYLHSCKIVHGNGLLETINIKRRLNDLFV